MLDLCGDDMLSRRDLFFSLYRALKLRTSFRQPLCAGLGRRQQNPVVRLGPAAGKVNLFLAHPEDLRHPGSGLRDSPPGLRGHGIDGGRIAVILRKVGQHHLQNLRPHRRRGRVIQIDILLFPVHSLLPGQDSRHFKARALRAPSFPSADYPI